MLKIRLVVNPPDDRVHLLTVDEDNPMLDVTVCGESPGGLAMQWADLVRDQADLCPLPLAIMSLKCFANLAQFNDEEGFIARLSV